MIVARLALLLPLVLAACGPSEEERAAAFAKECTAAEFTIKQCALLFAMKEKADNDANNAAVIGGVALGMSASSGGGRGK